MPRLSLYRPNKSADYKFFDRRISEMFTIGGTDILIHKYLGPVTAASSDDATQPAYLNQSERNIQDLLFTENRDRKYDTDVHSLRGVYSVADVDFDLSQFGLFLANDTVFLVFHYNDMIDHIGRKLIPGDVIELPHLTDYHPLNDDIPTSLKRFYVVQDASRASEGYSATWYNHLWRTKCVPLVDSQEYKDILKNIKQDEFEESSNPIGDILSAHNAYMANNDAIIEQAESQVPLSGYDTSTFYVVPVTDTGSLASPDSTPGKDIRGYLTGDGLAPNGHPVVSATSFTNPAVVGDYCLRTDYSPNRLFRWDGSRWRKVEDAVRTTLTPGAQSDTQRSGFVNNTRTDILSDGEVVAERQSLSNALRPQADN
jgi:hypothetical protein